MFFLFFKAIFGITYFKIIANEDFQDYKTNKTILSQKLFQLFATSGNLSSGRGWERKVVDF